MGALRSWPVKILRRRTEARARAIKAPARTRRGTLIVPVARSEFRTRATLRRTLFHPIPSGSGTAIGLPTLGWWRHRRAHFIAATAEILIVPTTGRGALFVVHLAMMTAHSEIALARARISATGGETIVRALHPQRAHVAVPPPLPLIETRSLFAATLVSPRAFAHLRTRFLIARRFAALGLRATRTVLARRWILLCAKWPGGKRE